MHFDTFFYHKEIVPQYTVHIIIFKSVTIILYFCIPKLMGLSSGNLVRMPGKVSCVLYVVICSATVPKRHNGRHLSV